MPSARGWRSSTASAARSRCSDRRNKTARATAEEALLDAAEQLLVDVGHAGRGIALAEATGGELVLLDGSGHAPHVRDPVKVNLLLREAVAPRSR